MENLNAGRSVGESGAALYRNSGHNIPLPQPNARPSGESARSVEKSSKSSEQDLGGSAQPERQAPTQEEIDEMINDLNLVFESSKAVRFDISDEDGDLVIQMVDRKSDEVVRTIPADQLAEVHRNLNEMASGALLDDKA